MADEPQQKSTLRRTVVILGASGYLGGVLCRFFHGLSGERVIAVARSEPRHRAFDESIIADVFADDWVTRIKPSRSLLLINCAFDFKSVGSGDAKEKFASFARNLAALSRTGAAGLINISTMSAYAGCRTEYGREKLMVEEIFAGLGGVNIRPGLIVSWQFPGAAFANLIEIVEHAKVVPILVAAGSGFYVCELEAVVLGVYLLAGMNLRKSHTISFCFHQRRKLGDLLRAIESRGGVRRIKLPLPWRVAYGLLLVKESLVGKSKVRADSVLDFAYPNPAPKRREAYARMIAAFRVRLEALGGASPSTDNFYFLEGPCGDRPIDCRLSAAVPSEILVALSRLSDA
jgi:nucleoside-diphosphate-sugar epimerase